VRLEIGRVTKIHGLRGDVVVLLSSNVEGRLAAGTVLTTDPAPKTDLGTATLTVERSRPHQDRWLVKFVGVDSREAAESIGRPLLYGAPPDDDHSDVLWIHELIGCTVLENSGAGNSPVERGTVTEVQDNPASDLLVLSTGALVPLTFVTSVGEGTITVEVPDGLFELYEG